MSFTVPKLKFTHDALEPYLSEDIVHYHYAKRTRKYFDTVNELIKGTNFDKIETLDELLDYKRIGENKKLFNNVAQAWNHAFYWNCLSPKDEVGKPSDKLETLIENQFSSFDKMVEQFNDKATKHFGSGWCWVIIKENKLKIVDTHDADNPITRHIGAPLLTVDLWEHSHELQYPADRAKYLDNIWPIINWNFINEKYDIAIKK